MRTILCDIDGTLADIGHRTHYVRNGGREWDPFFEACSDDLPKHNIIELVNVMACSDYRVILVTGRPEKVREKTEIWLEKHGIIYDALYMRGTDDSRKDFIVKRELLDRIRADFLDSEIIFVLDDRKSVVRMWREAGLTCLQVEDWFDMKDPLSEYTPGRGHLTIMVGPSGAGKSSWIEREGAAHGIRLDQVISTDAIRQDLCGDFKDQSKNDIVFRVFHSLLKQRLICGLPVVADATSLYRKDRLALVALAQATQSKIRYVVINRPMEEKKRDAGWRGSVGGLLEKHEQRFNSGLKEILRGDDIEGIEIIDARR